LPYAQWPGSWKEYLAFHFYSFYKRNLTFERTRRAAVTRNLIQLQHGKYVSSTTATIFLPSRVKTTEHLNVALSFTFVHKKSNQTLNLCLYKSVHLFYRPMRHLRRRKLINCVRNNETASERTRQRLLWTKRHKNSSNSVASSHYQRLYHPHCLASRILQDTDLALLSDSWKYLTVRCDA
jgi:hypothetical protein